MNLSNYKISSEDQRFSLGEQIIYGVQSINSVGSQGIGRAPYIGMRAKQPAHFWAAPTTSTVSIAAILVNQDYFYSYATGSTNAGMYIFNTKHVDTTQDIHLALGTCSSYSLKYTIGQIPTINTTWAGCYVDNQMDGITFDPDLYNAAFTESIKIPDNKSITLDLGDLTTNRLQSFEININSKRIPVYHLGLGTLPYETKTLYPIEISCSFTFEKGQYTIKNYDYNTVADKRKNISLTINSYDTNESIASYNFNNLILSEETYNTTIDQNTYITQRYDGLILK